MAGPVDVVPINGPGMLSTATATVVGIMGDAHLGAMDGDGDVVLATEDPQAVESALNARQQALEKRLKVLEKRLREQQLRHVQTYLHNELSRYHAVKEGLSRNGSTSSAPAAANSSGAEAEAVTPALAAHLADHGHYTAKRPAQPASSAPADAESHSNGPAQQQQPQHVPAAAPTPIPVSQLMPGVDLREFELRGRARRMADTLLQSAAELSRQVDSEATESSSCDSLDELDPETTYGREVYVECWGNVLCFSPRSVSALWCARLCLNNMEGDPDAAVFLMSSYLV